MCLDHDVSVGKQWFYKVFLHRRIDVSLSLPARAKVIRPASAHHVGFAESLMGPTGVSSTRQDSHQPEDV